MLLKLIYLFRIFKYIALLQVHSNYMQQVGMFHNNLIEQMWKLRRKNVIGNENGQIMTNYDQGRQPGVIPRSSLHSENIEKNATTFSP